MDHSAPHPSYRLKEKDRGPVLFGKSLFESVLDRLKAEQEETEEESPGAVAPLRHPFVGDALAGACRETPDAWNGAPERGYLDALEGTQPPPPPIEAPVIPKHLLRLSPEEIAEDLALDAEDSARTLNAKRRAFARENHPDRVAEPFRANASQRMTLANRMTDEALRRLQNRQT